MRFFSAQNPVVTTCFGAQMWVGGCQAGVCLCRNKQQEPSVIRPGDIADKTGDAELQRVCAELRAIEPKEC